MFPTLQCAEIALFDCSHDGGTDIHDPGLLVAILVPLPHATLRDLDISVSVLCARPTTPNPLPLAQFLGPAFYLHGLWAFRLTFTEAVRLSADDDVFAGLAAAWPLFRTLLLDYHVWHAHGLTPTPLVLVSLARSCFDLQKPILPYLDHTVELETLQQ